MYQRHSTSSTGSPVSGAPPQHQQQPYPFQRARSTGSRATTQINSSYDNNVSNNMSYSSMPDSDDNCYGRRNNANYAHGNSGHADYDNKYDKRNNANNGSLNMPAFIIVRSQVKSKRIDIETIVQEQRALVDNLDATTAKIKDLKREVEILHKDNELSFQELRQNGKTPGNIAAGEGDPEAGVGGGTADMESEGYAKMEEEEEILVQRIDRLEKNIQKSAVKRLSERYGNGQYRFKVNVRDQQNSQKYFVIETAMLAEMPHAIDHFFRMMEKKLWDGLALVHEPHSLVVSATPMMTDEKHVWAGQRFVDANLTHMAFTEHSPTYPPPHHRLYTVAFTGRPGGPGFYISLDNELEYVREQESTFGVVMEGRDVLYQFFRQGDMGTKKILTIESIDILHTKVLKDQDS
eukprot:jgi/Psemu1/65267/estExt_Genemark1.C_1160028